MRSLVYHLLVLSGNHDEFMYPPHLTLHALRLFLLLQLRKHTVFGVAPLQTSMLRIPFSPQYLHFPFLILWASKLGFASSLKCGGVYLEVPVFVD